MRILYVEDEKFLAEAVIHLLKKNKINVDWADDGEEGLTLALKPSYDCIVLDIMLPKLSGLDILKVIRNRGVKTPVIMLSALSEVETKVGHLDKGADDYLAKPFKTAELVARIKAVARRPKKVDTGQITYSNLVLDKNNATLNEVQLTAKEAEIITEFMTNPDKLISKEHLLAKIWGEENIYDENYVETYISRLRKTLKGLKSRAKIVTVRGLGYKLAEG